LRTLVDPNDPEDLKQVHALQDAIKVEQHHRSVLAKHRRPAQEGNKDGKALTALFYSPQGMAYDSRENLYIADMGNHCIRKLSPDGMVTTFAK